MLHSTSSQEARTQDDISSFKTLRDKKYENYALSSLLRVRLKARELGRDIVDMYAPFRRRRRARTDAPPTPPARP